ncbi:MAG: AMP-binding protein [bacterium]|nr:AMP-binding protein [bacterium]
MTYQEAVARREADDRSLGLAFLHTVQSGPRHTAIVDPTGSMSRVRLAAAALSLRDLLDAEVSAARVGVLLPPGKGGTVVNLALALAGRTAVNLNHTAGEAQLKRMCEIAEITTIITAQKYLDRLTDPPALPGRVLLADLDLLPRVSKAKTLANMARLPLLSHGGLRKLDRGRSQDVATIVFSSGTTGDPKGIQLTHAQILANIESARTGLNLHQAHVLLTALPLFHSFGLVPGFWLGLTNGVTISAFPNPRDPAAFGRHAEKTSATCMISTPTFCRQYLKKVQPHQFATMQFAIVGAEKCPPELRVAFEDRFKATLLEGYGCTELAPIVSANLMDSAQAEPPDYSAKNASIARGGAEGEIYAGPPARDGSVGRPLPGIEILIVDPETLEELPRGSEGLIIVRSPARMLGYLKRDDLTDAAFVLDGYRTGDMGRLDEDGFLFITGRLARFAKLGGEMVPLDSVEEALDSYIRKNFPHDSGDSGAADDESDYEVAVAAVPDPAKGERLVLLYTALPCPVGDLLEQALAEYPALFRPRPRDSYQVDELPVLGTGKRNLKGVKSLAEKMAAEGKTTQAKAGASTKKTGS